MALVGLTDLKLSLWSLDFVSLLSIFINSLKSFNAVSKLEGAEDPFALLHNLSTRVRAIKITFIALYLWITAPLDSSLPYKV